MGVIFTDRAGKRWVLVDKKQRLQTVGRFFEGGASLKEIHLYVASRSMTDYVWEVVVQENSLAPRTIDEEMAARRYKLLCPLEECDEEKNEFGVVSP